MHSTVPTSIDTGRSGKVIFVCDQVRRKTAGKELRRHYDSMHRAMGAAVYNVHMKDFIFLASPYFVGLQRSAPIIDRKDFLLDRALGLDACVLPRLERLRWHNNSPS